MNHAAKKWTAWVMLLIGIISWAGFIGMVTLINSERAEYAALLEESAIQNVRKESQGQLHSLIRETENERGALEAAVRVPIVGVVETIEMAGRAAGVRSITIVEATPQTMTAKNMRAVSVGLQAEGSFTSFVQAIALLETFPLVTTIEQIQLEKIRDDWRMNVRLQVVLSADTL